MQDNSYIPLQDIRVARLCRADWENMTGDDTTRFCQTCAKNVYNLSAMSRAEAEAIVKEKEGHLCVRFYQRSDGTMMTDDCPIGVRLARRPFKWLAAGAAVLIAWGAALFGSGARKHTLAASPPPSQPLPGLRNVQPVQTVINWFNPPAPPAVMGAIAPPRPVVMGKMAAPRPVPPSGGTSSNPGNPAPPVVCEPMSKDN